jgi:hypothetical protein
MKKIIAAGITGFLAILFLVLTITFSAVPAVIVCTDCGNTESTSDIDETGSFEANKKAIFNILKNEGFTSEAAAGVIGCMMGESAELDPTSVEAIFDEPFQIGEKKQKAIDCNFNMKIYSPGNWYSALGDGPAGIGIVGWTFGRNTSLRNYAKEQGGEWYELETQIKYVLKEFSTWDWSGYFSSYDEFKKSTDIEKVTYAMVIKYEVPANMYYQAAARTQKAKQVYQEMK